MDFRQFERTITQGQSALAALANAISAGSNAGTTALMYGGDVPSMPQIDLFINEMTHVENNPTGSPKLWAIYSEQTRQSTDGTDPCRDLNSTAPCLGVSGAEYPVVRVNLTFNSTPISPSNPIRLISGINAAADGAYIMRPYFDRRGFTGIVAFTKISDGITLTDELMEERAVRITTTTGVCLVGPPGASCNAGDVWNVKLDWSNCVDGTSCPGSTMLDSTPITTNINFATLITTSYKTTPVYVGASNSSIWVAASGDFSFLNPLQVSATPGAGNDAWLPRWVRDTISFRATPAVPSACTVADFYLVSSTTGEVRTTTDDPNATTSASQNVVESFRGPGSVQHNRGHLLEDNGRCFDVWR